MDVAAVIVTMTIELVGTMELVALWSSPIMKGRKWVHVRQP